MLCNGLLLCYSVTQRYVVTHHYLLFISHATLRLLVGGLTYWAGSAMYILLTAQFKLI